MDELKESLDNLTFSGDDISPSGSFKLVWADRMAGFDIFDLKDMNKYKSAIGDTADYLHLFMAMADKVLQSTPNDRFQPLLIASDSGGKRLFVRFYTQEDKEKFKYAYIALGNAVNQLPESAINGKLSFFAEVTLEKSTDPGFEKEAKKAARIMDIETRQAWESLIEKKADFLKTDLYVFHILKLYSWGFKVIDKNSASPGGYQFVRAKRPVARGTSRR